MEQGAGEVQVMTVHGAKGLEAPIVFLPDTTSTGGNKRSEPLLMLDGGGDSKVPLCAGAEARLRARREGAEGRAEGHRDGGIPPPPLCRR
jgi:ATP-dependent helicase/nuclease subunit A